MVCREAEDVREVKHLKIWKIGFWLPRPSEGPNNQNLPAPTQLTPSHVTVTGLGVNCECTKCKSERRSKRKERNVSLYSIPTGLAGSSVCFRQLLFSTRVVCLQYSELHHVDCTLQFVTHDSMVRQLEWVTNCVSHNTVVWQLVWVPKRL